MSNQLEDQIARRCVHFTGVQHPACKLGIPYSSVRSTDGKPYPFPCIRVPEKLRSAPVDTCPSRHFPTPEEIAAEIQEIKAAMKSK